MTATWTFDLDYIGNNELDRQRAGEAVAGLSVEAEMMDERVPRWSVTYVYFQADPLPQETALEQLRSELAATDPDWEQVLAISVPG